MVTSRSPDRLRGSEPDRDYAGAWARGPLPPSRAPAPPVPLVGDGMPVPCVDGTERPYLSFDAAASTGALSPVLAAVEAFVPWYSSVHRGAGYKSQLATAAYEGARTAALSFARPRPPARRGRCGDHLPQHHRSAQSPGLPPSTRARGRRGHHGRRASRQPAAVVAGGDLPVYGWR